MPRTPRAPLPAFAPELERWLESMEARGLSKQTVLRRTKTLRRWVDHAGPSYLTATGPEIERWLQTLAVSPQSRGYYLGDLRAFYRWAVWMDLVPSNPCDRIIAPKRPRRKPRPIATDDLTRAIDSADERMRRVLVLAAFAGLRVAEVAGLDATDIDWERGCLMVRGKGNVERLVPMHPMVREVLADCRRGPAVPSRSGQQINPTSLTQIVSEYLHSLGIDKTCHKLRHWFCTETFRQCRDLRVVQELAGHASPQTTAGYTDWSRDTAISAVEGLSLSIGG